MNGGRMRGRPIDIDGCLSGLGYMLLIMFGCFALGAVVVWLISPPALVCKQFKEVEVIETITTWSRKNEVLVKKRICVEWMKPS